jgi:phage/plasmid primase-like uncharacterized protein
MQALSDILPVSRSAISARSDNGEYHQLNAIARNKLGDDVQFGVYAGSKAVQGVVIGETPNSFALQVGEKQAVVFFKEAFKELPSVGQKVEIGDKSPELNNQRPIKLVVPEQQLKQEIAAPAQTAHEKTYLAVPFAEKTAAKELGAKWDKTEKLWYAPEGVDIQKFEKWMPKKEIAHDAENKQNLDPKAEFAKALKDAGLVIEGDPVMDGKLQRVSVSNGKSGRLDGAYVGYLDGKPSGFYQNFKSGIAENWTMNGVQLTAEEQAQLQAQAQIAKQQRATELAASHEKTAASSLEKWEKLSEKPGEKNAYLERKEVAAFGVKTDGDKLIVPARDIDGKLWSLQTIHPNPDMPKYFEKGGKKTGNMHVIGDLNNSSEVIIAEGYATGASIHTANNKAVVIAFDSGNIDAVTAKIKERYPTKAIFIAADNDREQVNHRGEPQNVGVEKALQAAEKHKVGVIVPDFKGGDKKLTDFNDLHVNNGLAEVKKQIEAGISKNMEFSRSEARLIAEAQGLTVQAVQPNGRYTGQIVTETAYHSTQNIGGNKAVVHDNSALDKKLGKGQMAAVEYQNGKGRVLDKSKQKTNQIER